MFKIFKDKILGTSNKRSANTNEDIKLTKSLSYNISLFEDIFTDDQTIIFRKFENQHSNNIKCCIINVDGMVDYEIVNENVIEPIMSSTLNISQINILDTLLNKIIISANIKKSSNIDELIGSILYGDTVLLVDGSAEGLIIDTKGWEYRSITEPSSESVVRGPKEGFCESMLINLSLIRRKIRCSNLKFKYKEIGRRTKTKVCISYIEGLASQEILKELIKRLDDIDIDGILESGYIEELIKDSPLSPFKTIGHTERPDTIAANLLEGRIAIICDGTPFVLSLPYIFIEYFQANEDYYDNFIFSSFNRFLRFFAFFLSISVPSIYLALTTYHQEMIPTPLLLGIASAREGVPFPTVVESLFMGLLFEILREAGVRLPTPIGQAVSIVGALVLGEAAVTARFVSAPMVIITALTGISSFLVPNLIGPVIIIRLIFLILSSFLGLYGYIFGIIGLFIYLMSMRSFGIPYMLHTASINKQDLKDTAIRAPWWLMYYRPKLIANKNPIRKIKYAKEGK